MWWLGSLPCAYQPIRPVTSSRLANTLGSILASNTSSSFLTNPALPPSSWIKPPTSCGSYHEYCHELPSVKPLPAPAFAGSNGSSNLPFASRGCAKPVFGLNTLRQFCARLKNFSATSLRPIASAIRARLQSSNAYSSVLETDSG